MSATKGFIKGTSGNPSGRPKGTGKPKSSIRGSYNKNKKLIDESYAIIQKVLAGNPDISKDQFGAAKYVLAQELALHKAMLEEDKVGKPDEDGNEVESEEDNNETKPTVFSLTQVK